MDYIKSFGVIIFRRDNSIKYLILHYGLGHWDFAKGMQEKGESETETAEREAAEETGVNDLKFIEGFKERISYFYKWGGKLVKKDVVFFLAETKKKRINLSFEHDDYKWLDFKEAMDQLTFDTAKKILKNADNFIKKKLGV